MATKVGSEQSSGWARVTQRSVAEAAGVDVSTVSLCLSGHPRISESTRSRVLEIAGQMGYRPDPALASIAASRWSSRRDDTGLVIGFIVDDLATSEIELRLYFKGIVAQAEVLGYRVEPFELKNYPDVSSLLRILRVRSTRGIITGQSRRELPARLFADAEVPVVHCGYLRDVPGDLVRPDLRAGLTELVSRCMEGGARVVCCLPVELGLQSDRVLLGAALGLERTRQGDGSFSVLQVPPEIPPETLQNPLLQNADRVITINERHARQLVAAGGVSQNCIFTLHTLPPFEGKQGVDLRLEDVGRAALNLLEIKLRYQLLAGPGFRQNLLVVPRLLERELRLTESGLALLRKQG